MRLFKSSNTVLFHKIVQIKVNYALQHLNIAHISSIFTIALNTIIFLVEIKWQNLLG